jgi:hypothetical protein
MKGRIGQKTPHQQLISEVSRQIELFVAQPPMIKERIEALIDKGILRRNDQDKNLYEYIS